MNPVARVLPLIFSLAASGGVWADTVALLDGTEYEGEVLCQTKDSLIFRVRWGGMNGSVSIPKSEVADIHIKPLSPDPVALGAQALRNEAEQAAAKAMQDPKSKTKITEAAEAWVRLGDYYQRHLGYSTQAREAYEKALLYDYDQAVARDKLGYIKEGAQWVEKPPKRPEPAARVENVTIGLRQEEQRPESKPENREPKIEVPVIVVPPPPPYGGYGWGGSELVIATWPGYGYWPYLSCFGGYYPSYGLYGGVYWPGYSYGSRYGYGGSFRTGGIGGGYRGRR